MTVTAAKSADSLLANRYIPLTSLTPLQTHSDSFPTHEARDDTETEAENRTAASFGDESVTGIEREHAELGNSKRTGPKVCFLSVTDIPTTIWHPQELVKIGTIATVGSKVRKRAYQGFMKKDEIKLANLPPGCHDSFRRVFTPLLRQFMGSFQAWETPSDDQIVGLWYTAFPYHRSQPTNDFLYTIVKLVRRIFLYMMMLTVTTKAGDRIFEWRSKMAHTAMATLEKMFRMGNLSAAGIADMCEDLLGPNEKKSCYYYREPPTPTEKGKVRYSACPNASSRSPQGIFLNPLIAATLGTHFSGIASIPAKWRSDKRPEGALVTAIQAVRQGLRLSHASNGPVGQARHHLS
jgi:hypothetical protein